MKPDLDKYIGRTGEYEFPDSLKEKFKRAKKLEWITIIYLSTVVVAVYLVMGSSQAMKAVWIENVVSMLPAIIYLISAGIYNKKPNSRYPYGYHKAFTVGFMGGSVALLLMGTFIFVDSWIALAKAEHPTIGTFNLFGRELWLGWLMIVVLLYSFLPALILGRKKLPFAKSLHIKLLFVDSQAQKADWMTGLAGIAGVLGIGMGFWWADAVAAIFISLSILKDGWERSRDAMRDLMEEIPYTYDNKRKHPVLEEVVKISLNQPWVSDVEIRFREHGMVFFGDVFVIPNSHDNLVANIESLYKEIKSCSWHIEDVVIHPVSRLPNPNVLYKDR